MKFHYALLLFIPTSVLAAPIDGTWKTDMSSMKVITKKPEVYKLKDGKYTCESCIPSYSIKADGSDQPVKGRAYADTIAVTVTDPMNVTISAKKDGKPTFENTMTVSADGNTMTQAFKSTTGASPVTGTQTGTRVGKAPKGEHAISGKWLFNTPPTALSDAALTVTFATSADGLMMKSNGMSYQAKFGGKPVPIEGDPGKTMAAVKMISDKVITENDYRNGKKIETYTMTVSADGSTASVVDKDLRTDTVTTYTMHKQS